MSKALLYAVVLLGTACQVTGLRVSISGSTTRPGSQVTITCTGNALEKVINITAPDGTVYRAPGNNREFRLPIKESEKQTGVWKCSATSMFGSTSASVRVIFDVSGSRLSAEISYRGPSRLDRALNLGCKVTGPADATVTWYKDGQRLSSDSRVTLSSFRDDGGVINTLVIATPQSSDAGTYRCEARSGSSVSRVSARVYFSDDGPVARTTISPDRRTTASPVSGNRLSATISYRGPSRLDRALNLGCKVTGPADATVTWYKDGLRLSADSRVTLSSSRDDGGVINTLVIATPQSSDAGTYRCEVRSGFSVSRVSARVYFSDGVPATTRAVIGAGTSSARLPTREPPIMTTRGSSSALSARISYQGPSLLNEPLVLDCVVNAPIWSTVSWYKDGRRIFWSLRSRTSISRRSDGSHHLLTIRRPRLSDAGNYRCEARSFSGVTRTSTTVYFSGSNGEPVAATTRATTGTNGRVSARLTSSGVPTEGQSMTFDCKVSVPEGASVTLTKDLIPLFSFFGRTLTREVRADGLHYLYRIKYLTFLDSGTYRCEVRSRNGSFAKSERRLSVKARQRWSWWGLTR